MTRFQCNLCGAANTADLDRIDREASSCRQCGSAIRTRAVIAVLAQELFGMHLPLTEFPMIKTIRGLGMTDPHFYAPQLERCFDYRNSYYDRPPYLDILNPDSEHIGKYDFVICSEVLEHVAPPVETAFHSLARLLKPGGVLILTTPYSLLENTIEHFPSLHQFGFADLGGKTIVVNRTREGSYEVIEDVRFHGGEGSTLEMRIFCEADLRRMLAAAGLSEVTIHSANIRELGVVFNNPCSLPIAARSEPFRLARSGIREMIEHWLPYRKATMDTAAVTPTTELQRQLDESAEEIVRRGEWAKGLEAQLEERTKWAADLQKEAENLRTLLEQRTVWANSADKEAQSLRIRYDDLTWRWWTRLGRKLRILPRR